MEYEEWTGKVGLKRQKNSVFEASLMRRMQPYAFTVSASSSGSFSLMLESNPDKDVSMFLKISSNLRGENATILGAHFKW